MKPHVLISSNEVEVVPIYATSNSVGMDIRSTETMALAPGEYWAFSTNLRIALPSHLEGQIRPRSGLAFKHGVTVLNAPGTIDSDYRGEIKVLLINHGYTPFQVTKGDRIAQLVIAPVCRIQWKHATQLEVENFEATSRGQSGFGGTGVK